MLALRHWNTLLDRNTRALCMLCIIYVFLFLYSHNLQVSCHFSDKHWRMWITVKIILCQRSSLFPLCSWIESFHLHLAKNLNMMKSSQYSYPDANHFACFLNMVIKITIVIILWVWLISVTEAGCMKSCRSFMCGDGWSWCYSSPCREAEVCQQQQLQEWRDDPKGGNSSFMFFCKSGGKVCIKVLHYIPVVNVHCCQLMPSEG